MKKWADSLKDIVKSQEKFLTFSGKFYVILKKICQLM